MRSHIRPLPCHPRPIVAALLDVDGFVLFTDGETWAGRQHASQALAAYRRQYSPGARVAVASMAAAGHSIAEPKDAGVLNIAGIDAALPTVVTWFIRG